jgi:hypothetical protein
MFLKFKCLQKYIYAVTASLIASHSVFAESNINLQQQDSEKGERILEYIKAISSAPTLTGFPSVPGIDSATTAPHGIMFVSAVLGERTSSNGAPVDKKEDGNLAFGIGLGDAHTGISAQLSVTLTSVQNFAASGYANLKFSRLIYSGENPIYAGVSFDRLGGWGDSSVLDSSQTLSITGFSAFISDDKKYPFMWTLGYGSNTKNGGSEKGFQAGVGMGIYKNTSIGLSTNGDQVNAGLSFNLPDIEGASISVGVSDVFDNSDARSASIGVNYTISTL